VQKRIDVGAIENRAALEDRGERGTPLGQPADERAIGVEFAGGQAPALDAQGCGTSRQPPAKDITE
jgi:hypothetical protein